jgi:hypothetical protein
MGTSCKKPARANTKAAAEFVTNFLMHVHSDMNVLHKDPTQVDAVNAALAKNPDSVVTGYTYDKKFTNVKVSLSTVKLARAFGRPAERIWRKLFIRLYPGGRSLVTGESYDSGWIINPAAERLFVLSKQKHMKAGGITPAQLLDLLEALDEQLTSPTEFTTAHDLLGYRRIVGLEKKVVTRTQRRAILAQSKPLRDNVRDYNDRLFEAMCEQHTFHPVTDLGTEEAT